MNAQGETFSGLRDAHLHLAEHGEEAMACMRSTRGER